MKFGACDNHGCIAQLVEQLTLNQWVWGSSPHAPTKIQSGRWPDLILVWTSWTRTPLGFDTIAGFASVNAAKPLRVEGPPSRHIYVTDGDVQSPCAHHKFSLIKNRHLANFLFKKI